MRSGWISLTHLSPFSLSLSLNRLLFCMHNTHTWQWFGRYPHSNSISLFCVHMPLASSIQYIPRFYLIKITSGSLRDYIQEYDNRLRTADSDRSYYRSNEAEFPGEYFTFLSHASVLSNGIPLFYLRHDRIEIRSYIRKGPNFTRSFFLFNQRQTDIIFPSRSTLSSISVIFHHLR